MLNVKIFLFFNIMNNLYINTIFNFSEVKNFGIKFNLFETNILNLIVVIGVLIYYGRPLFLN